MTEGKDGYVAHCKECQGYNFGQQEIPNDPEGYHTCASDCGKRLLFLKMEDMEMR